MPAETDTRRPHSYQALWAYAPKAGLVGQAFAPEAPPAAGSVQLKLGARRTRRFAWWDPTGSRWPARVAPAWLRTTAERRPGAALPTADALGDRLAALTDANGKGEIQGCRDVDIVAVRIEAAGFGSQLSELGAEAGGARAVKLLPAGRLNGRVRGDDPSAARGVEVIAVTSPRTSKGLWPLGRGRAMTDADGRFEFPALAAGTLRLDVFPPEDAGLKPRIPSELAIEPGRTIEVAIALEGRPRERTVAGRVVDRAGRPVAGATVFQSGDSPARTEATTGTDGRFTLSGVVARPTFLFVRKAGCRFAGLAIGPGSDDVTLAIHTVQEPPRVVRKTLPPPLSHEEDIALARRLLDPYAELVLKKGGEPEKIRTLEALARVEPERAIELLQQKKVFQNPFYNGMLGLRVAVGLMDESIDEALAVLEGLEDPAAKAMGFIQASDKLAARDRSRALAVLDRALLSARAAKEPEGIKLLLMGQVAERFLDLGQAERGRALCAREKPWRSSSPGRASWATREARSPRSWRRSTSTPRWRSRRTSADAFEFDRHHGNIAHELAGRDPAQAERVLAMLKDPFERGPVRAAGRLSYGAPGPRPCPPPGGIDRRRRHQGVCPGHDGPPPRRGRQGPGARGARECLRIA